MADNSKLLDELAGDISLGDSIKDARERFEMTQQELGDAVGKSPKYISDMENGRRMPSLDALIEMVEVIGDNPNFFIKMYFREQLRKANVDDRFEIVEKAVS